MDFGPNFEGEQACMTVENPDMFFPHPSDRAGIAAAKEVCNSCNFITECLSYAVRHPELQGVWGGLTQRQRETLRSKLRNKANVIN